MQKCDRVRFALMLKSKPSSYNGSQEEDEVIFEIILKDQLFSKTTLTFSDWFYICKCYTC